MHHGVPLVATGWVEVGTCHATYPSWGSECSDWEATLRPEPPRDAETVAAVGEFNLIHRVTTGRAQPETTILGPGDDAAVVAVPDGRVVASMDMLVEGVHFSSTGPVPSRSAETGAVNLADVVAMERAVRLLVGFACPADAPRPSSRGSWRDCGRGGEGRRGHHQGDMVSSATLVISITAMGRHERARADHEVGSARRGRRGDHRKARLGRRGTRRARRGFRSPVGIVNAQRHRSRRTRRAPGPRRPEPRR